MAYSDGKLIRYDGTNWAASNSEDFFFKVYFDSPVAPVESIVDVDYLSGIYKGVILNDSNELTTDTKFLMSVLVDDTVSMSWSDPADVLSISERLPTFFENIIQRTQTTAVTGYTGNYDVSYVDFWIYTSTEINRSLGFTNSLTNVQNYASSLYQRGLTSTLLGTVPLIINGLNERSVFDAFFKDDDDANNSIRVNYLVLYLDAINCLRLQEIYDYWDSLNAVVQSGWGTGKTVVSNEAELISTIKDYTDVSEYVVKRWAKSFTPLALVIADGDNSSSENVSLSIQSAQSAWDDQGIAIYTIGLGKSQSENYLRTLSSSTNGAHFYISQSADWDDVETALVHGGDFSIFSASCFKTYDYDNLTWISKVDATFTPSVPDGNGRSCKVEIRWSSDRVNFTPWFEITSGVSKVIKKLILVLEYKITMTDGWNGSVVTRPVLNELNHTIVEPSTQYLFTPPQQIDGMMFETLMSATAFLPDTATATWGVSRGDSIDFADFAPVHVSRKGALPNRQSGVLFTEEVIYSRLPTQTDESALVYYVYTNSTLTVVKTWSSSDEITVYQRINAALEIIVPSSQYVLDGDLGTVTFLNSQAGSTITVTVRTPPNLYISRGEKTSTKDYKTYYLTNGRWSRDNSIIVLVNDKIVRGGFWENPDDGSITFGKEREVTDIVAIYVEFADVYRVGVEIKNYDPAVDGSGVPIPLEIKNFALFYNVLENVSLQNEINNTLPPYVTEQLILPRTFNPSGVLINPTYKQRLTVSYKYNSPDNASESGTITRWWRYRAGQSLVGQTTQTYEGFTYILLTSYNNRITQKKSDVGVSGGLFSSGDKIFVEITPSDGYSVGNKVVTPIVTLVGDEAPYILTLKKPVNLNTSSPAITAPSDALSWSVSATGSTTSYFGAGTYYVGFSYFNSAGETVISKLKSVSLTDFQSISISSIDSPFGAVGINYYCSIKPNPQLILTGSMVFSTGTSTVTGTSTLFSSELKIGDLLFSSSNVFLGRILSITNNTTLVLTSNSAANFTGVGRLIPVFLAQTNTGSVTTIISELTETVYVSSPNITRNETTGLFAAPVTDELTATFTYRNPDSADNLPDETIVEWYLKDNPNVIKFSGKTVAANSTVKGQVYIFKATPYNGTRYGIPVWSAPVLMT
jgi:hypothetical protein